MEKTFAANGVPTCAPAALLSDVLSRYSGATPSVMGIDAVQGINVSRVRITLGEAKAQASLHLPFGTGVVRITDAVDEGTAQGPAARGRPL